MQRTQVDLMYKTLQTTPLILAQNIYPQHPDS